MQITDVRIRKISAEGKMKGIVSVTFDNEFVMHDIKVIEGQMGLFIAMPSRKTPDGEFKDIAHPINRSKRKNSNCNFRSLWKSSSSRKCRRIMIYEIRGSFVLPLISFEVSNI